MVRSFEGSKVRRFEGSKVRRFDGSMVGWFEGFEAFEALDARRFGESENATVVAAGIGGEDPIERTEALRRRQRT